MLGKKSVPGKKKFSSFNLSTWRVAYQNQVFLRLEQLRKQKTVKEAVIDYDAELASYRES